jgi:hypothetical protein
MDKIRLYYDRHHFDDTEAARDHFLNHWADANPSVKRKADRLGENEAAELYQGAHYDGERWHFYSEIKDFRKFDPTQTVAGADNVIVKCSRCGLPAIKREDWRSSAIYIHILGNEGIRESIIVKCEIPRRTDGLIDASS